MPEHASLEQLAGALHAQLVPEQDGPLWARPSTDGRVVIDHSAALLEVKDAAAIGVTIWWVRQLIARGELRAINVGGPENPPAGASMPRTSTPGSSTGRTDPAT